MFAGLLIILLISIVGELLSMNALTWIMSSLKTVWVLAFVIIFQPELRRLLVFMGQSRLMRRFVKDGDLQFIEAIIKAVFELSKKNFGALIALKRNTGLKSVLETGVNLQANISSQLIASIFNPRSPMHDGALVVQNDIALAAQCILPLSQNDKLDPALGTRHRAALGLSEQSDAFVIVISEETGMISYAEGAKLTRGITETMLRNKLNEIFAPKPIGKLGFKFSFDTGS
jgi:diadenylate cyclase